ncbi:MAG: hypothetical protein JSV25_06945 [Spirochaetota bacterium]|nr:MAG: hypothetical protein JSV25_06945 [Spirochaetota bacterium]
MQIKKIMMLICFGLLLLSGCGGGSVSNATISIVSITPTSGSPIAEGTVIEAILDYTMSEYEYISYQITIYFETTTGGYVVAGDNPSLELTYSSGQVTHTYTVSSMDVNNAVVKKPYEINYTLEKSMDDIIWEEVAKTAEVIYTE